MMSGKETAVVSRRGAGAGANAADLMEVRAYGACGWMRCMRLTCGLAERAFTAHEKRS